MTWVVGVPFVLDLYPVVANCRDLGGCGRGVADGMLYGRKWVEECSQSVRLIAEKLPHSCSHLGSIPFILLFIRISNFVVGYNRRRESAVSFQCLWWCDMEVAIIASPHHANIHKSGVGECGTVNGV